METTVEAPPDPLDAGVRVNTSTVFLFVAVDDTGEGSCACGMAGYASLEDITHLRRRTFS